RFNITSDSLGVFPSVFPAAHFRFLVSGAAVTVPDLSPPFGRAPMSTWCLEYNGMRICPPSSWVQFGNLERDPEDPQPGPHPPKKNDAWRFIDVAAIPSEFQKDFLILGAIAMLASNLTNDRKDTLMRAVDVSLKDVPKGVTVH